MTVPQDPYGAATMHADLIINVEKVREVLNEGLLKVLTWLMSEK